MDTSVRAVAFPVEIQTGTHKQNSAITLVQSLEKTNLIQESLVTKGCQKCSVV